MKERFSSLIFLAVFILGCVFIHNIYASQNFHKRIISLGTSITEELYLLGVEGNLVGDTIYCVTPDAARYKEKVGSITQIDIEKIIKLNPDLVLATSLTNPRAIQKLKDIGVEVKIFPAPKNFTYLCDQFLELGKIVGKEDKAKIIITEAKDRVTTIKAKVSALPKPKVFIEVGAKPLTTANREYFVNDFVELAGGINIAEDAKTWTYNREDVVRKNADVIIIVTMGIAAEKEKEIWEKFTTLNAVKDNRIYIVDSRKICSPTPVTFVETLDEIAGLLHPKIERNSQ